MRTEQLNPQHPEIVALLRGPICLFPLTDQAEKLVITNKQLVGAQPTASNGREFQVEIEGGSLKLAPFSSLTPDEKYSLYVKPRSA